MCTETKKMDGRKIEIGTGKWLEPWNMYDDDDGK